MSDIIMEPGKFEGEATYIPEFWDKGLDGLADYDEFGIMGFLLTLEDCKDYSIPEENAGNYLYLWESGDGFVYSEIADSHKCLDCHANTENPGVCDGCADIYANVWEGITVSL